VEPVSFEPIGILKSDIKHRYEAPKQGILAGKSSAVIHLNEKRNFEQALKDLHGFGRIWIIFCFHKNTNWKPMVRPPLFSERKIGVFATRAPFRPNPIGISCVKLLNVDGLKVYITESDILDGSPILDIKPYLPYSDAFPDSLTGWASEQNRTKYIVKLHDKAKYQTDWLKSEAGIKLENFINVQLESAPADYSRKRIKPVLVNDREQPGQNNFILAYRTWRIYYSVNESDKIVEVIMISSGYLKEELEDLSCDKYSDKTLHQKFNSLFTDNGN